jgi:MOSC domain-containing protein YiiM
MWQGAVVSIHIGRVGGGPLASVAQALAAPGKGLEGDRYASGLGTYSDTPGLGREITLLEIEAIEALKRDYAVEIDPGDSRRNIVTRGVALNHLVGREFTVGEARLRGVRLCEPCAHLERLTRRGVRAGLIHRGGLRAEILTRGAIRVGDPIRADGW